MNSELRQRIKRPMPITTGAGGVPARDRHRHRARHRIRRRRVSAVRREHPSGLLVARGRFNPVQLEGLAPRARRHGRGIPRQAAGSMASHRTTTRQRLEHSGNRHARVPRARPGRRRRRGRSSAPSTPDERAEHHQQRRNDEPRQPTSSAGNNAWAVGRFDVLPARQAPRTNRQQIPPVKWFAAAGHINGGVSGSVRAEAKDERPPTTCVTSSRASLALGRMVRTTRSSPRSCNSLQLSGSGKTVSGCRSRCLPSCSWIIPTKKIGGGVDHQRFSRRTERAASRTAGSERAGRKRAAPSNARRRSATGLGVGDRGSPIPGLDRASFPRSVADSYSFTAR